MARALSTASKNGILACLSDGAGLLASRRAYSTASPASPAATTSRKAAAVAEKMLKRESSSATAGSSSSAAVCSWVPDPVTGYYRPANRLNEVDAAELREMLLKKRSRA